MQINGLHAAGYLLRTVARPAVRRPPGNPYLAFVAAMSLAGVAGLAGLLPHGPLPMTLRYSLKRKGQVSCQRSAKQHSTAGQNAARLTPARPAGHR
jgi:hypothetical protein